MDVASQAIRCVLPEMMICRSLGCNFPKTATAYSTIRTKCQNFIFAEFLNAVNLILVVNAIASRYTIAFLHQMSQVLEIGVEAMISIKSPYGVLVSNRFGKVPGKALANVNAEIVNLQRMELVFKV